MELVVVDRVGTGAEGRRGDEWTRPFETSVRPLITRPVESVGDGSTQTVGTDEVDDDGKPGERIRRPESTLLEALAWRSEMVESPVVGSEMTGEVGGSEVVEAMRPESMRFENLWA